MRPAEIGPAIIKAAEDYLAELRRLAQEEPQRLAGRKGATLAELAEAAQVGRECARHLVPKLKSRGHLVKVGSRRVDYRNRPVLEYAPGERQAELPGMSGAAVLAGCMQGWQR